MKTPHILSAALAAILLPFAVVAATTTVDGVTWTYTRSGDGTSLVVTGAARKNPWYPSVSNAEFLDLGDLTIPSSFPWYGLGPAVPVTAIADYAFSYSTNLTSIAIPASVKHIGSEAFYQCPQLSSAMISDGVESIGAWAFYHCGLTEISIPDSVKSFGESAFRWCPLLSSIAIPNNVSSIPDLAFYSCNGLEKIDIGEGVTSIGEAAFDHCYNIESVAIRNGQLIEGDIAENAFQHSGKIKDVVVPGSFRLSTLFPASYQNITNVVIAPGKKYIDIDYCLVGCQSLRSISFPVGMTSISGSFPAPPSSIINPPSSISIVVPEDSTAKNVFPAEYQRITSASLPPGATKIKASAFAGCTALASISIPYSVRSIGDDAFSGCSMLTDVCTPDLEAWCGISFANQYSNPARMSGRLFSNGAEVVDLVVPGTVSRIGDYAFCGLTNLTSVSLEEGVSSIGEHAFSKSFIDAGGGFIYSYSRSKLTSVVLPNSVTDIAATAFWGCSSIKSVIIPGRFSLSEVFPDAYTSVDNVIVSPGSTSLGGSAFSGCSGVISITLPDSMENVANGAFSDCSGLATISIPSSLQSQVQSWGLPPSCQIVVRPSGTCMIVLDSAGGSQIAPIVATVGASLSVPAPPTKEGYLFLGWSPVFPATMPLGGATLTAQWTPGNNCTITFDSAGGSAVASISAAYGSALTAPAVPTRAGYTFAGWSPAFPATMPEGGATLTARWTPRNYTIRFDCDGGSTIAPITAAYESTLSAPEAPTKQGYVFSGWSPAFPSTMPLNGKSLAAQWTADTGFFKWSVSGNTATITGVHAAPSGLLELPTMIDGYPVTGIGSSAFRNCSELTSVIIPDEVSSVCIDAFVGCTGLSAPLYNRSGTKLWYVPESSSGSFTVSDGVTDIGSNAFRNCIGLTTVTIPDGVTNVDDDAFAGCSELTAIFIPESLEGRTDSWGLPFGCAIVLGGDVPVGLLRIPKAWLWECAPSAFAVAHGDWAVAARITAANGVNKVWECYVAGLDPDDPTDRFLAEVVFDAEGNPDVVWSPNLGSRGYVVEGKASLTDEWGEPDDESRFFRVKVALPDASERYTIAFDSAGGSTVNPIVAIYGDTVKQRSAPTKNGYTFAGWSPAYPKTMPFGGAMLTAQWNVDASFFQWTVSGNEATITGVNGTLSGSLEIPPEIDGYPVTGIGSGAFYNRSALTSITIPHGVANIGTSAFYNCSGLTSVSLPDSVTNISACAFESCSGLTSVAIASGVTRIGDGAFSSCSSLTSFVVSDNNAVYASQDGLLLTKDGKTLLAVPAGVESVAIPSGVTHIGDSAFSGCPSLTSVTIPSSVTSIGDGAFSMCYGLASITIPSSVTSIGNTAFSFCSNLSSITIPSGATSIGNGTFSGCTKLTSITLPDSLTTIGSSAFDHSGLTSIRIPDYVTSIGDIAFAMCSSLSSISIPYQLRDQTSNWSLPSSCQIEVRSPVYGTITFDSAGGSSVPSMSAPFGTVLTEPAAPTKSGYTFAGWSPAFPETMPAGGARLTAQWTKNYTISFDSTGGSAVSSITAAYGSTLTAPANPTKGGYTFAGWSPEFPATMPEGGAVLTAQWSANTYDVKFNANGGSGTMSNESFVYGTAKALTANAFTRTGYTFAGWATSASGSKVYNDKQSVSNLTTVNGGTVNLYAVWTGVPYSVKFNANGGSGSMADESFVYGTTKALTENAFTRTGYLFAGWAMSATGTKVYNDKQSVSNLTTVNGGTVNLYAVWTQSISYSVKFNANGGSGSMSDESFIYGTAKALTPNAFTRTGYIFAGWATSATGSKVYDDQQSVSNLTTVNGGTVNLYAVWSPPIYCVIDLSAGSSASSYPVAYLAEPPSGGFNTDAYKTTKLVLKRIEAGSFKMQGSTTVTLTKPFYIGLFEVTQKQYQLVVGSNPSSFSGDKLPVVSVSYNTIRGSSNGALWPASNAVDSSSFMGVLRTRTGLDFDLPTEAQWEYACRAGTTTTYSYGSSANGDYMWYSGNSTQLQEVGTKQPNLWGLYDMHGNVYEWCLDWYGTLSYGTDPKGSSTGDNRVVRGGCYFYGASDCTSSYRYYYWLSCQRRDLGFRLAMTLSN